jgi:hypothetical protein
MSTSGVTSYNPTIAEIIDEAYERAGIQTMTGHEYITARRSLNLLTLEWANRGINLWTLDEETLPLTAGVSSYTLPTDTVDVLSGELRLFAGNQTLQSDSSIDRISFNQYASLPNKLAPGRPTQFMIHRGVAQPTIYFWLVPDQSSAYSFYYWRMRRIQDPGSAVNTSDVPFRFIPALISGLAYHLAAKRKESMALVPALKERYDHDWDLASDEDRDRSPLRIVPYRSYR